MSYPLTVAMTPAFYFEGDWLLRAQLRCLSEQTAKDFDVLLVDHHFNKRRSYMPELATHYNLNIVHVPYRPATHVAKKLDCAIFNAPYCYSESPRIVRLSCWRFVRPGFTQACLDAASNVDFYFHSCEAPAGGNRHPVTDHDMDIWNMADDVVHWDKVPNKSSDPGATWTCHSDTDSPSQLFPENCYGNYMVRRLQWLDINGADETFTNVAHYEDMDFCQRARNNFMTCERRAHLVYRMHHWYGNHSGRANISPDVEFTPNCEGCSAAILVKEPRRYDIDRRTSAGEIELFDDLGVWVCRTCKLCGPVYHADCGEHIGRIKDKHILRSNIIPKYKIGRNLNILASDMDGRSLDDKVSIYNGSWTNERYYAQAV